MGEFGQIAMVGALGMAVYAIVVSLLGVRLRQPELVASGRYAALANTALLTTASLTLVVAFLTNNFSLRYVYDNSNRAMPPDMITVAFYSGQAGSLLFWAWSLSLLTAFVLWRERGAGAHRPLMPYVVAVLMFVQAFMGLVLGFIASPFERLPFTPPDGVGLNPLLYDEGMRIHPPLLLMGYMAWSVPFAFAVAALATRRLGNEWVVQARRYSLVAWLLLGMGNLMGGWWAYRVLGWGGIWGWDPVENVAIMPWLVGTAFIHSIQIQERRNMLRAWNMALILVTFSLSIFGTFIVRSGVLASVHSFALSPIGPYFFSYLGIIVGGSAALFFWRLPLLRSENQLDSLLSREAAFLLNNLVFLGITFAIFWGTIYPLISEMLGGTKTTVGPPYFQQVVGPLLGGMLLLMGVGPLLPWRGTNLATLRKNFIWPLGVSSTGAVGLFVAGVRTPPALIGFVLCLFVLTTLAQEFWRGAIARARAADESFPVALVNLTRRNNRRYGGYLVHLAMILVGTGLIGSTAYQQERVAVLSPGETITVGAYTLQAQGLRSYEFSGGRMMEAPLLLGSEVLRPHKLFFRNFERQPSTEVAIRTTPFEDLYIVLSSWEGSGTDARVNVMVFVNPLVPWIWVGGFLFLVGSVVAMWPTPQPAPRRSAVPVGARALGAAA